MSGRALQPAPVSSDPQSLAASLSHALLQAKLEELTSAGIKALPLEVSCCCWERHGKDLTPILVVDLCTGYDFTKVSRLEVDVANVQKFMQPERASRKGLLMAVPVILHPHEAALKLVFTCTFFERGPVTEQSIASKHVGELENWSLRNSRGDAITVLACRSHTAEGSLQSTKILRGSAAEVMMSHSLEELPAVLEAELQKEMLDDLDEKMQRGQQSRKMRRKRPPKSQRKAAHCAAAEHQTPLSKEVGEEPAHGVQAMRQEQKCELDLMDEDEEVDSHSLPSEWQTVPARRRRSSRSLLRRSSKGAGEGDPLEAGAVPAAQDHGRHCGPVATERSGASAAPAASLPTTSDSQRPPLEAKGGVLPDVAQLLRGWQASVRAVESSGRQGRAYWCYRRNENACWRLSAVPRLPGARNWGAGVAEPHVCEECAWGRGAWKLCTCRPDPWQPLPELEPDSGDPLADLGGVTAGPSALQLAAGASDSRPPSLGAALPQGVEDWRHLLRGTHAFSLQGASEPVSLFPEAPDAAVAARRRQRNIGWRRWWLAQQAGQQQRQDMQPPEPFLPTPTASCSGTPRSGVISEKISIPVAAEDARPAADALDPKVVAAVDPKASWPSWPPGQQIQEVVDAAAAMPPSAREPPLEGLESSPTVLLPVPLHLALPMHRYLQELCARQAVGPSGQSEAL